MTTVSSSAPARNAARDRGLEVVIGVAVRAVHHDQRARDRRIRDVERVRRVDHRARRPAAERDPPFARSGRRRARRRGAGRDKRPRAGVCAGGAAEGCSETEQDKSNIESHGNEMREATGCPDSYLMMEPHPRGGRGERPQYRSRVSWVDRRITVRASGHVSLGFLRQWPLAAFLPAALFFALALRTRRALGVGSRVHLGEPMPSTSI